MDNIIEIKEGAQGMNLDPITALLFEQQWLHHEHHKILKDRSHGTPDAGRLQKIEGRLAEIGRQIEELGNKTFML